MGDPAVSITYKCTIDGFIPLGIWTKIEGLGFEYEVKEYREGGVNGFMHKIIGPLQVHEPAAVAARSTRLELADALAPEQHDQGHPADDGDHGADRGGDEITTWNLAGVVPVKWTGPSLDIMGNEVATETLEVAYEEIIGLGALGGLLGGRDVRRRP